MSSSFSSDSFSTSSFDTDSFLFDVITGVLVQPGGGSSSEPEKVVEAKRRTYPKDMPQQEQDDQDFIDLMCAVVQFIETGTH